MNHLRLGLFKIKSKALIHGDNGTVFKDNDSNSARTFFLLIKNVPGVKILYRTSVCLLFCRLNCHNTELA